MRGFHILCLSPAEDGGGAKGALRVAAYAGGVGSAAGAPAALGEVVGGCGRRARDNTRTAHAASDAARVSGGDTLRRGEDTHTTPGESATQSGVE